MLKDLVRVADSRERDVAELWRKGHLFALNNFVDASSVGPAV